MSVLFKDAIIIGIIGEEKTGEVLMRSQKRMMAIISLSIKMTVDGFFLLHFRKASGAGIFSGQLLTFIMVS